MKKLFLALLCVAFTPIANAETVTIDAMKLSMALYGMPTTPSKEEMIYEMEGATVKLVNARLYAKDTSNGWYLIIGDNTPRVLCEQKTKAAKRYVVALKKILPKATVTGKWKYMSSNRVYLENCTVDGL